MAANPSIQLGTDGNWAIKEDNLLAYKKDGTRFFNKEFDFTRNTTATFVGKNGLIQQSATNTPRIDFTDDATGHLLLEPQSTNLREFSETFIVDAKLRATINNDVTETSPSGSLGVEYLTATSSNGIVVDYGTATTGDGTFSVYLKRKTGVGVVRMSINGGFDYTTMDVTDEWKRFSLSTTTGLGQLVVSCLTSGDEVYIWGWQEEALPYATSYIPTSGSTVTRNAEVCNNSGSSQDFNSEEGVLYAEISQPQGTLGSYLAISNGNTSNRVIIGAEGGNIKSFITGSGSSISMIYSTYNANTNKVAIKYKSSSASLFYNGSLVSTTSSAPSMSGLSELKFTSGGSGQNFYGKVKNIKVFKRALSDGELYLLTVPQYQSYQEMATALNYTL